MSECVKTMSQFSMIAFFLTFFISDVDSFIKFYEKEINETLKLNFKKKETENMKEPKIQKQFSNQILSNGLETPPFNFK